MFDIVKPIVMDTITIHNNPVVLRMCYLRMYLREQLSFCGSKNVPSVYTYLQEQLSFRGFHREHANVPDDVESAQLWLLSRVVRNPREIRFRQCCRHFEAEFGLSE